MQLEHIELHAPALTASEAVGAAAAAVTAVAVLDGTCGVAAEDSCAPALSNSLQGLCNAWQAPAGGYDELDGIGVLVEGRLGTTWQLCCVVAPPTDLMEVQDFGPLICSLSEVLASLPEVLEAAPSQVLRDKAKYVVWQCVKDTWRLLLRLRRKRCHAAQERH